MFSADYWADRWHDGPGPWFLVWLVGIVLFWGTVIFFVSRAWRRGAWGPRGPYAEHSPRSAYALLAERYARGEISEDEYRERRAVLAAVESGAAGTGAAGTGAEK